ncbi:MAG: non-hydrolyzing UDP-N-acetylglucosamine 2-epimerase [Nanobdellota archaeon]
MKILTIVGARPQFIKAAIFSKNLEEHKDINEIIVHTGQHYDKNMSDIFFKQLKIPKPKYNLNINGGNHGEQTGKMMVELEKLIIKENPDMIIVYGDTNSTLAASLVGSKLDIPVSHIEAGFRSHDKSMPEELNRICTDHVSRYLFCPTLTAVDELKKENIRENVYFVGDITYDAAIYFVKKGDEAIFNKLNIEKNNYYFATVHRAVNTDNKNKLENIFDAFLELDRLVVIPLHPRTKNRLKKYNIWDKYQNKNILFIEPTNYLDTLKLIKNANKILTDSGGVLRESYFLKKNCIVLRDNIEFIEAVENKEAILVGANKEKIIKATSSFNSKGEFKSFFGEGNACKKIIEIIKNEFKR